MPNIVKLCAICTSPERDKINGLIAQGADIVIIRETYGFTDHVIRHHRDRHMRGIAVRTALDAIAILRELQRDAEQADTIIAWAMENQKYELVLKAIYQHRETLLAMAKITGAERQLDPRVIMPYWEKIKGIILGVVEKFPEVSEDLLEAVNKVEENR